VVEAACVRRLAMALPEAEDKSDDARLVFEVKGRGFAWSFNERAAPKKPRAPRLDILAVRCPIETKEMLIEAAPDRFFDDDHYRGYPAVLIRLPLIDEDELDGLLRAGWALMMAAKPKRKPRPA
jgi:hypothetical protein